MTLKYTIGSKVTVRKEGEYFGISGVATDFKAFNSAFPVDKTVWRYAVRFDNGKTKWFSESDLTPTS